MMESEGVKGQSGEGLSSLHARDLGKLLSTSSLKMAATKSFLEPWDADGKSLTWTEVYLNDGFSLNSFF